MSVNDIQFQLGEKFTIFIDLCQDKTSDLDFIDANILQEHDCQESIIEEFL